MVWSGSAEAKLLLLCSDWIEFDSIHFVSNVLLEVETHRGDHLAAKADDHNERHFRPSLLSQILLLTLLQVITGWFKQFGIRHTNYSVNFHFCSSGIQYLALVPLPESSGPSQEFWGENTDNYGHYQKDPTVKIYIPASRLAAGDSSRSLKLAAIYVELCDGDHNQWPHYGRPTRNSNQLFSPIVANEHTVGSVFSKSRWLELPQKVQLGNLLHTLGTFVELQCIQFHILFGYGSNRHRQLPAPLRIRSRLRSGLRPNSATPAALPNLRAPLLFRFWVWRKRDGCGHFRQLKQIKNKKT